MAKQNTVSVEDLFAGAVSDLQRGIERPNIYGYTPYHEQECFHRCGKIGRYLAGGNRGGKTDAMVAEMVYWATDTHPYLERPEGWGTGALQLRCFVVDVEKGVNQILIPKLKRYIPQSFLIDEDWDKSWNAKGLVLTLTNGTTIDFLTYGMGLEKMGGVPRHIIFFDEEPPQHIFTESQVRLLDYGGKWVIAATPVEGIGWTFDHLWEPGISRPDDPRSPGCFTLSAAKNPYLKTVAEEHDLYSVGMDEEERKMRFEGEFVARSGLIFPEFDVNTHCIDFEALFGRKPPPGWRIYTSVDHGLNNPTAWLWHAVSPNGDIVTFAEHYRNEMLIEEHSQIVHQMEAERGISSDIFARTGDPAMKQRTAITGTNILQEYARRGLFIGVEGIPHEVEIGLGIMRSYFKPRPRTFWGIGRPKWVISYQCPNLIKELKKLRYASYESQKKAYDSNKQEIVHKKDDHAFDSARYFATLMPDLSADQLKTSGEQYGAGPRSYADLVVEGVASGGWEINNVTDDEWD